MKKIRYGVIGVKGAGQFHLDAIARNSDAELTAVADIDSDACREIAEKSNVPSFQDFRKMLETGCVDAVSIATPHATNGPIALECLKAGIHTFIEKPMCSTVSEADALIATAKSKGLKICVGHQYRLNALPQAWKRKIANGELGKILHVLWTFLEFRSDNYFRKPAWRQTWSEGSSGVLSNQASHELDVVCWLLGKPVEVSALAATQLHSVQVEDAVSASVQFENGALGSFQFTLNQVRCGNIQQIAGDRGILRCRDGKNLVDQQYLFSFGRYNQNLDEVVKNQASRIEQPAIHWQTIRLPDGGQRWKRPERLWKRMGLWETGEPAHSLLMRSFLRSIRNEGEPLVTGESVLPVIELVNGMILSAVSKKTVRIPIDRDEYDSVFRSLRESSAPLNQFMQL